MKNVKYKWKCEQIKGVFVLSLEVYMLCHHRQCHQSISEDRIVKGMIWIMETVILLPGQQDNLMGDGTHRTVSLLPLGGTTSSDLLESDVAMETEKCQLTIMDLHFSGCPNSRMNVTPRRQADCALCQIFVQVFLI